MSRTLRIRQSPPKQAEEQEYKVIELQLQKQKQKKRIYKSKQKKLPWLLSGPWTPYQNLIYKRFLKENYQWVTSSESRRQKKFFQRMCKKIRTRTSVQCRSHHQKMVERYRGLENILQDQSSNFQNCFCLNSITQAVEKNSEDQNQILNQIVEDQKIEIMNEEAYLVDQTIYLKQKVDFSLSINIYHNQGLIQLGKLDLIDELFNQYN